MKLATTALLLAQAKDPGPAPESAFGNPFVLIVLMVVFFYFMLIRPQQREQAEKKKLMDGLKKNDRVITTAGLYGTVVNVKDDAVTLLVDDQNKVKLRFLKSAVASVVVPPNTTDEAKKS